MADGTTRELSYDLLVGGDRASVLTLGVYGAESLKRAKIAVFMVDVLGRVQIMAPGSVKVLVAPKVSESDLDAMSEDEAISVMTAQGDSDEAILTYLKSRNDRSGTNHGVEDL